jgi:segregation and condensation protein A
LTEGVEGVVQHLLFHRALLADGEDGAEIARYVAMVEEISQGVHLVSRDPTEEVLGAVFELVLEERMDPWDIDLGRFAQVYLEKVRKEGRVDFIVAGRLILMAWSVLRLQSDGALKQVAEAEAGEEPFFSDWEVPEGWEGGSAGDYALAVIGSGYLPLRGPLRRRGGRGVTLMDLVKALREAEAEAMRRARMRPRSPEAAAPEAVEEKVHAEEILEDTARAWALLGGLGSRTVVLGEIWPAGRLQRVTLFIALLFLAAMGKVELRQEDLERGEVLIKVLETPGDLGAGEPIAQGAEVLG